MRVIAKEREDARVFYDHYRDKTAKLEKQAQSDSTKIENHSRNMQKLAKARERFEKEN